MDLSVLNYLDKYGGDYLWLLVQLHENSDESLAAQTLEERIFQVDIATSTVLIEKASHFPNYNAFAAAFIRDGLYILSWSGDPYNSLLYIVKQGSKFYIITVIRYPILDVVVREVKIEELYTRLEQALEANNIFDYTILFTRNREDIYMQPLPHRALRRAKRTMIELSYMGPLNHLSLQELKNEIDQQVKYASNLERQSFPDDIIYKVFLAIIERLRSAQ